MEKIKRILVCPLDWGLGHATRCIPVIRQLIVAGATVVIAADNGPMALLQQEFPNLQFVLLPGYEIKYSRKKRMHLKMLLGFPKLIKGIRKEHRELQGIIKQYAIDAVISDNRFGLWTRLVPCVFITHQVCIKAPMGERIIYWLNRSIINKYNVCWVPDDPSSTLSGELSSKFKLPSNCRFIGALSRFSKPEVTLPVNTDAMILALISGPEPQRHIFEQLIIAQLTRLKIKSLVVRGIPEDAAPVFKNVNEYVQTISHLQTSEMERAITKAAIVICRSGYSSIMDLAVLGKKALFIPTPGQTEQEYLATYFMQQKIAFSQSQSNMDLLLALETSDGYTGFKYCDNEKFKPVIDKFAGDLKRL